MIAIFSVDEWTIFYVIEKDQGQLKHNLDLYVFVFFFFHFCTIKENSIIRNKRINCMEEMIKTWNNNLLKSVQYDKQLYVMKLFPTPTQINSLDKSEQTRLAREALNEFSKDKNREINERTFWIVRDYFLIFNVNDNASCPCPVAHMTLGELKLLKGMMLSLAWDYTRQVTLHQLT